jgi:hypothetical protein
MRERIAGPRGTGKPLQIAVEDVTGTTDYRARGLLSVSCHGIVGSDGTRRCMMGGRFTFMAFGFGGFASLAPGGLPKVRCGFGSRASAANLTASTASTVRQRIENRNTFTRRGPGSISIRPRWSSSFSDGDTARRPMW